MKIEMERSWPLSDGRGTVRYYTVGKGSDTWSMEASFDSDGKVDPECDANVEYARNAAKAWTAWAEFVEQKNKEGWA
jgi:hypothetical protein